MKKEHLLHYIVLAGILAGGVATFFYLQPNTAAQVAIGIATTVAYILWGLIHHAIEGDLHQRVVVEYLLIGAIAVILLLTVVGS